MHQPGFCPGGRKVTRGHTEVFFFVHLPSVQEKRKTPPTLSYAVHPSILQSNFEFRAVLTKEGMASPSSRLSSPHVRLCHTEILRRYVQQSQFIEVRPHDPRPTGVHNRYMPHNDSCHSSTEVQKVVYDMIRSARYGYEVLVRSSIFWNFENQDIDGMYSSRDQSVLRKHH